LISASGRVLPEKMLLLNTKATKKDIK
jgi:hypothetical protein